MASKHVKISDFLLLIIEGQPELQLIEILNIEDKPTTKPVVNVFTLDSYNIIANNIHCSTHTDGDGDDLLFNVVNFCYHKITHKTPTIAFYLNKGYKKLFRK